MKFWTSENSIPGRFVTPFGECGLKFISSRPIRTAEEVTPFGECGLKWTLPPLLPRVPVRHSLRGVWVEIYHNGRYEAVKPGHSLRGVWVEMGSTRAVRPGICVTPFGECGLKYPSRSKPDIGGGVTPFGECGLKFLRLRRFGAGLAGHSLRGVWVEILART